LIVQTDLDEIFDKAFDKVFQGGHFPKRRNSIRRLEIGAVKTVRQIRDAARQPKSKNRGLPSLWSGTTLPFLFEPLEGSFCTKSGWLKQSNLLWQ
jgi:hypothetical protein